MKLMSIFSWLFPSKTVAPSYQPTPEQLAEMQASKAKADKMEVMAKKQAEYEAYNMQIRAEQEKATAAFLAVTESNKKLVAAKATMPDLVAGNAAIDQMIIAMEAEQRKLGLL
jgi:hypothetical protein